MTFNEGYPAATTFEWLLTSGATGPLTCSEEAGSSAIMLEFLNVSTECSWDRLYVYDGKSFRDNLIGVFSGNINPRPLYAYSNHVLLYFFSDVNGVSHGFKLRYSLVDRRQAEINRRVCQSDAQCNDHTDRGVPNTCIPKNTVCRCDSDYSGVFCSYTKNGGRLRKWHLMSVSEKAAARTGHTAVLSDCQSCSNAVWIFGGFNLNQVSNELYRSNSTNYNEFNIVTSSNAWPSARYQHTMVVQSPLQPLYVTFGETAKSTKNVFGDEALFVHGGILNDGSLSNELWKYDVPSSSWSALPSSPLSVAYHVMVLVDNRWIFVHGGLSNESADSPVGDMYYFDTKESVWTKVPYESGFEPSLRLAGHSAVYHSSQEAIYIYGGYTQDNAKFYQIQNVMWRYHIRHRIWAKIRNEKTTTTSLVYHSSVLHSNQNQIIIYGGQQNTSNCQPYHLSIFDLNCLQWISISGDTYPNEWTGSLARVGQAAVVADSSLFVYGGLYGSLTESVMAFHLTDINPGNLGVCQPCRSLVSCAACVLFDGCSWCPKDKKCISTLPSSGDKCSNIDWGDNSAVTSLSECRLKDSPAGWFFFIYRFPKNQTQPDEVHLATSSVLSWITPTTEMYCDRCLHYLEVNGLITGFDNPDDYDLTVYGNGNTVEAYAVVDHRLELIANLTTRSISEKYSGKWIDTLKGGDEIFVRAGQQGSLSYDLPSEVYIKVSPPESRSFDEIQHVNMKTAGSSPCDTYKYCMTCATNDNCGWCGVTSSCLSRNDSCGNSDWLATDPLSCSICSDSTNCLSCTQSSAICEWLPSEQECIRRGRSDTSFSLPSQCPSPCSSRPDCSSCLSEGDECLWCPTLSTCIPMDDYSVKYSYGECLQYLRNYTKLQNEDVCKPCSFYTNCTECLKQPFCGWCSHDPNPAKGVCVSGDFSSPTSGVTCRDAVEKVYAVREDTTWSFRTCPDLKECLLHTHECVENAECHNTPDSYECKCERGYKGDGRIKCEKTCYYDCVHGDCVNFTSASSDIVFKCQCELGWTGVSCNQSCGCNNHSTCNEKIGICDKCQDYTRGQHCELCVPNSYGSALEPEGCTPCQCNGHGDKALECDRTTGKCNCVDNTVGDACDVCATGYFGDPRNGSSCFQCYHGRLHITGYRGSGLYGSEACRHAASNMSGYLWTFDASDSSPSPPKDTKHILTFELLSIPYTFPSFVTLYTKPEMLMSESDLLLTLTYADIGSSVTSESGHLTIAYKPSDNGATPITFRIMQKELSSHANNDFTTNMTNDFILSRYAYNRLDDGKFAVHGGITPSGHMSDELYIIDLENMSRSRSNATELFPSPRYSHALCCTNSTCFMYGGIVDLSDATTERVVHLSSNVRISKEFWIYELFQDRWKKGPNEVVPPLIGHTMVLLSPADVMILGGITSSLRPNTVVYIYSNNKWRSQATYGTKPFESDFVDISVEKIGEMVFMAPVIGQYIYVLSKDNWTWRRLAVNKKSMAGLLSLDDRLHVIEDYWSYPSTYVVLKCNQLFKAQSQTVRDIALTHRRIAPFYTSYLNMLITSEPYGPGFVIKYRVINGAVQADTSHSDLFRVASVSDITDMMCKLRATPGAFSADNRKLICLNMTSCSDCLSMPTGQCVWHSGSSLCMDAAGSRVLGVSQFNDLVWSASTGHVNCTQYTSCRSCQGIPSCGWCSSKDDPSGRGTCVPGDGTSKDICTRNLQHSSSFSQWNYLQCPPENECVNDHHTCKSPIETCQDKLIGFDCVCSDGYELGRFGTTLFEKACAGATSLVTNLDHGFCLPICDKPCVNGCCNAPNNCTCSLGYVGEQCEKKCECNGYSDCTEEFLSRCLSCQKHTTGSSCERCERGYVGDPPSAQSDSPCVPCEDVCNGRSNKCDDGQDSQNDFGPTSKERTTCRNCTGNSEGVHCEKCKDGFFELHGDCVPCQCNGHGRDGLCDHDGVGCSCENNTRSSQELSYKRQCDDCLPDYDGVPSDSHQCYRIVNAKTSVCFDPDSRSNCRPLPYGHAAYYLIHPMMGHAVIRDVDLRVHFQISKGVVDIYIATTPTAFIVKYDPISNEHVVTIDESADPSIDPTYPRLDLLRLSAADLERFIRSTNSYNFSQYRQTTTPRAANNAFKQYHQYGLGQPTMYFAFNSKEPAVVKLSGVTLHAVINFPSHIFNYSKRRFYVVVKAQSETASGKLRFHQDPPGIHALVVVSVLMSIVFLILSLIVILWKMHRMHQTRLLQANRQVQLHQMAERPFSSKILYLDFKPTITRGANNMPYNIVPLAVEPVAKTHAAVATVFMLIPGDKRRPMKAALASVLLNYQITFPPSSTRKERSLHNSTCTNETRL